MTPVSISLANCFAKCVRSSQW